ncbi:MAG: helicase [Segetibacter sp.]|nr:helicase [Segetibacter sp.]
MENLIRKERRKSDTTIYGKVPPQAKAIEEVVLGALMLVKAIHTTVMVKLFPECFYVDAHQRIYKAILNLYDKSKDIDMETVIYQLKANGDLETIGGPYAIAQLTNKVASTANLETHISIILETYLKREAIRISNELAALSYEDGADAFDIVSKANDEFLKAQERIMKGGHKNMSHYVMNVAQNRDKVLRTGTIGISTGFKELDKVIGGWVNPDLIVIAARPGMGKTALMLTTLHYMAVKLKKPGAVFSLEMSGEQLTERLEAIDSGIFHQKLRYNQLNDLDRSLLLKSENRLSDAPIHIDDKAGISIRDIKIKASLFKRKYGIEYVMIDYLQLMKGVDEKGKSREQVISEISRGCKEIAKELDIPVIALSQLSRAVESRADKMPQLSDLRESGSIEQDADEVIFLMRPEYYNFIEPVKISAVQYDVKDLVICKIDKNRHGATKNIALRFEPELMRYGQYEKEVNEWTTIINEGF